MAVETNTAQNWVHGFTRAGNETPEFQAYGMFYPCSFLPRKEEHTFRVATFILACPATVRGAPQPGL